GCPGQRGIVTAAPTPGYAARYDPDVTAACRGREKSLLPPSTHGLIGVSNKRAHGLASIGTDLRRSSIGGVGAGRGADAPSTASGASASPRCHAAFAGVPAENSACVAHTESVCRVRLEDLHAAITGLGARLIRGQVIASHLRTKTRCGAVRR